MKIDAKVIKDFIRGSTINNNITEYRLSFKEDGLYFWEMEISNVMGCKSFLSKKIFSQYDIKEDIAIGSGTLLSKILGRFEAELEAKIKDNRLFFSGIGRKGTYTLSSLDRVPEAGKCDMEKMSFIQSITLPTSVLKNALEDAKKMDETGKETCLIFETKKGELTITTEGDDGLVEIFKHKSITKPIKSKFGSPLKDVIAILPDEECIISLGTDYMIKILIKREFDTYIYLVAPRVGTSDNVSEEKEEDKSEVDEGKEDEE